MSTIITEIEYTIEIEPEMDGPEGNFSEEEDVRYVREQMEWNEWAWCCVKVTSTFRDYKGYDYLGGCSYKDEQDFKQGGYYEDMCYQARVQMVSTLEDELGKQFSRFLKDPSWTNTNKLIELSTDYRDLMEELKGVQS